MGGAAQRYDHRLIRLGSLAAALSISGLDRAYGLGPEAELTFAWDVALELLGPLVNVPAQRTESLRVGEATSA